MSYDLVLKDSKHNWARGACCSPISATARLTAASTAAAPKPPTLAELNLTPDEKKKLAGVAAIKKASQSGDKHAQRQWKHGCGLLVQHHHPAHDHPDPAGPERQPIRPVLVPRRSRSKN